MENFSALDALSAFAIFALCALLYNATHTTAQGLRTIALNAQTTVRRENGSAQFSDFQPGIAVAVWGDPGEVRRTIVARVIAILAK